MHKFIHILLFVGVFSGSCVAEEMPGKSQILRFDAYCALAATDEMVRRTMSPLRADRVHSYFEENAITPRQQSLLLTQESFDFYLPNGEAPPSGYGLLVFIAPSDQAAAPSEWREVLDRFGFIYVAARKSGNDQNVLERRIPLALHAYENVSRRYQLDPKRVYISGFSGGSRVAMRVALFYPDVFKGAILNAGSDPFGNGDIAIPSQELFKLFQDQTRMVQVTGTEDTVVEAGDVRTRKAARGLCMRHLAAQPMHRTGHVLMDGNALGRALTRLDSVLSDKGDSAQCHEQLRAAIDAELDLLQDFVNRGLQQQASKQLTTIDDRYGGLAAPRSLELARKIASMKKEAN